MLRRVELTERQELPSDPLVPLLRSHLATLDLVSQSSPDVRCWYLWVSLCIIVSVGEEEILSSEGSLTIYPIRARFLGFSGTV